MQDSGIYEATTTGDLKKEAKTNETREILNEWSQGGSWNKKGQEILLRTSCPLLSAYARLMVLICPESFRDKLKSLLSVLSVLYG